MAFIPKVLIIAGSDPSSGAGIQSDLKVATSLNVFCATVITSLTAQNSTHFYGTFNLPVEFFAKQLESVLDDFEFDAIKIGMVQSVEIISAISDILKQRGNKARLIVDPMIVSTTGGKLLAENALDLLKSKLIAGSDLVMPNIDEAEVLSGIRINNLQDMKKAAQLIKQIGCHNVLIKGGHFLQGEKIINLLLNDKNEFNLITNKRLDLGQGVRGTGCKLSTAIACNLAKGDDILEAARKANKYLFFLLKNGKRVAKVIC